MFDFYQHTFYDYYMESKHTIFEHGRPSDSAYTPTAAESCNGIDAETLTLCGNGPEHCSKCPDCDKPVCDEHGVELFGLKGRYCFPCAKAELDLDEAADALIEMERTAA